MYFKPTLTGSESAPMTQQKNYCQKVKGPVPRRAAAIVRFIDPDLIINYWTAISNKIMIQKVTLLNRVLNTLISDLSTTLQFIILNRFISTKVWKHIVSRINLVVACFVLLFLNGVYIRFGTSSKNIRPPKNINMNITRIWYSDCTRIYLHIS